MSRCGQCTRPMRDNDILISVRILFTDIQKAVPQLGSIKTDAQEAIDKKDALFQY